MSNSSQTHSWGKGQLQEKEWGGAVPQIFGVLFYQEEDEWMPDSERKISTTGSFHDFPN